MAGKNVISKITIISTKRKGIMARVIDSTRSPETEEATNKTNPIGGVASPTVKFTLMIIAKWTGWIPRSINIGPNIGPRIMIAGPASRNMPTMNKRILIKNSKMRGCSETDKIKVARYSGAWLKLTTVLKAIAAPTNKRTTEDVKDALVRTSGRSDKRTLLKIKRPMKKEYPTATAAASVGVNMPNRIPPRIISGVIRGKNALSDAVFRSDHE